ncbi:MAG TPA: four helix bundle protein [Chitinophagaceae bacterium]
MSEYRFSFERLEVWQLARELTRLLYKTTSKFPPDERFGLISQIRRAAVSVAANIAEGSSRMSPKDQARFTVFSFSSLIEVFNHLTIAKDLEYIDEFHLNDYRKRIQLLSVKLTNYRSTQLRKSDKPKNNPTTPPQ